MRVISERAIGLNPFGEDLASVRFIHRRASLFVGNRARRRGDQRVITLRRHKGLPHLWPVLAHGMIAPGHLHAPKELMDLLMHRTAPLRHEDGCAGHRLAPTASRNCWRAMAA